MEKERLRRLEKNILYLNKFYENYIILEIDLNNEIKRLQEKKEKAHQKFIVYCENIINEIQEEAKNLKMEKNELQTFEILLRNLIYCLLKH